MGEADEAGPQSASPAEIRSHSNDTCKDVHCRVTGVEIWWHLQPVVEKGEEPIGRIPLVWVETIELDPKDGQRLLVNTIDARQVKIRAQSPAEAKEWQKCMQFALDECRHARNRAAP